MSMLPLGQKKNVHAPKITKELRPFFLDPNTHSLAFHHHSENEVVSICGASSWRCTRWRKLNQNCLANTQETRRWSIFSSSWSHSGQVSGWFIPRFANRSAVQHFLWATSQTKNRHFTGAQVCQVLSYGSNSTEPLKNPSYADLTLNFPLVANLQKWISSFSSWCSISDKIFHRCRYSTSTPTVRAPRMSDIHLWPRSAFFYWIHQGKPLPRKLY
jgi:hypothetical protein